MFLAFAPLIRKDWKAISPMLQRPLERRSLVPIHPGIRLRTVTATVHERPAPLLGQLASHWPDACGAREDANAAMSAIRWKVSHCVSVYVTARIAGKPLGPLSPSSQYGRVARFALLRTSRHIGVALSVRTVEAASFRFDPMKPKSWLVRWMMPPRD